MKIIYLKRKTSLGKEDNAKFGTIETKITHIKKYLLGLPIKTLRTYREAYYGDRSYKDGHMFI